MSGAGSGGNRTNVGYLIVFVISVIVGVAVFLATIRTLPTGAPGFGEPAPRAGGIPQADPASGTSYVPITEDHHDWQARLTGLLGLVVSVVVAGIALAVSLWAIGALIGKLVGAVAGDDPAG